MSLSKPTKRYINIAEAQVPLFHRTLFAALTVSCALCCYLIFQFSASQWTGWIRAFLMMRSLSVCRQLESGCQREDSESKKH